MLRLLSDEHVPQRITRGLRRREPGLDIVHVQDVGLGHTPDPQILEWAAAEGRVVITADVTTLVRLAWARVRAGQPMPGILALTGQGSTGRAIADILLAAACYSPEEMAALGVVHIPFPG